MTSCLRPIGRLISSHGSANSYLPEVLRTRRGLPITLSLVYKVVAERLGLRARGIGLPGHFLCGVEVDGKIMLVDAFAQGRIITVDEAHARMQEMLGPDVEWSDEMLQPVSNRHWLTRMLDRSPRSSRLAEKSRVWFRSKSARRRA